MLVSDFCLFYLIINTAGFVYKCWRFTRGLQLLIWRINW